MNASGDSEIDELTPDEVWAEMSSDPESALVDVRTRPEWLFVGIPDLEPIGRKALLVEWQEYPRMEVNADFEEAVNAELAGTIPANLYFMCRSGQRSLAAARAFRGFAERRGLSARCVNVAEGFEGTLDSERRRSRVNGWKKRGLPWRQS